MKRQGNIVLQLEYDPSKIQGVRLTVPLLGIDEHILKATSYERIPAGNYEAHLTAYCFSGQAIEKRLMFRVLPGQTNSHKVQLGSLPHEVIIKPVDNQQQTVLYTEIKIENVDANFRLVRDKNGLACMLQPGEYTVKMILPNMEIKSLPLKVTEDTLIYAIPVEAATKTRQEPRFRLAVPVLYRAGDGQWISTKTRNISSTGICLLKGSERISEKEVFVRLFIPISKVPLECNARVRWTKEDRNNPPQMGLQLVLSDSMKSSLRKWLNLSQKTSRVS